MERRGFPKPVVDKSFVARYDAIIMSNASPSYRVVCAVIRHPIDTDCYLAAQRPANDPQLPGMWEFPGGKIEPGESEVEALKREIREELALEIEAGAALTISRWSYPRFHIELIPFLCTTTSTDLHPVDHQCVKWTPLDALMALSWAPADVPIVKELIRIVKP